MSQDTLEFPVIEGVEGGLSDDGQAVLLKLTTVEDAAIHFCLRHSDLEAFVTYLLCMASSRKMRRRARTACAISRFRHPGSARRARGRHGLPGRDRR